jgi:hypothetical protein
VEKRKQSWGIISDRETRSPAGALGEGKGMEIEVNIPDGESGKWRVEEFEISKLDADFANIRASMRDNRYVSPGKYKKLTFNNQIVMSNTPAEILDHMEFMRRATGSILINGLGLGVALSEILKKSDVTSVTIVEISEDVIKLVGPTFLEDNRVIIIHADALEWKPPKGKVYDYVWHDIWNHICTDNLEDMKKLHRRYGRRSRWQGSWCRETCEYYKKRESRNPWR